MSRVLWRTARCQSCYLLRPPNFFRPNQLKQFDKCSINNIRCASDIMNPVIVHLTCKTPLSLENGAIEATTDRLVRRVLSVGAHDVETVHAHGIFSEA